MVDVVLPVLPAENEDPWYAKRQAFDIAVKGQIEGPLSKSELNATFAPLLDGHLGDPLTVAASTTVTVEANGNQNLLAWDGAGGVEYQIRSMTAADQALWCTVPMLSSTWWNAVNIAYPDIGDQWAPPWYIVGATTNSKRIVLKGNIASGRDLGPWILVNGAPLTQSAPDYSLVYDGNEGGILLTFPSVANRSIEFLSTWGIDRIVVDAGMVAYPFRRPGPKVAIIGDSWIEGTSQGGTASVGATLQAATPWRVAMNAQGGTGYVASPGGGRTAYGDTTRATGLLASLPDLVIIFGSINDGGQDVTTAASALLTKIATDAPLAKVIILGPQYPSANQVANLAELNAAAAGKSNVIAVVDNSAVGAASGATGPVDMGHPSPLGVPWVTRNIISTVRTLMARSGDRRF